MKLNRFLALHIGLIGLLCTTPAFATAVLEGDENNGFGQYNIQLIEGDELKKPPIPKLQGSVETNEYVASTAASPVLYSHPGQQSNIPSLIYKYNRNLDPGQVIRISQGIHHYSRTYGIDPRLVACLVAVESSFRPAAISSSGAIGLGQLKPETAKWLGVMDPYDPIDNLSGVAKYLSYLLNRYNGSVQHALAAYFQGQGTIDKRGIDQGAQRYISKVNEVFTRYF